MPQERYQEAAEACRYRATRHRRESEKAFPQKVRDTDARSAERFELAAEVLTKLASGEWVLCKPNHRETEGGILKWTEYDPVELP